MTQLNPVQIVKLAENNYGFRTKSVFHANRDSTIRPFYSDGTSRLVSYPIDMPAVHLMEMLTTIERHLRGYITMMFVELKGFDHA